MNNLKFRNPVCPLTFIVIPANGYHWSKAAQLLEHFGPADIAGMKNQPDSLEGWQDFSTEKSVSVGDNADDFFACHELLSDFQFRVLRDHFLQAVRDEADGELHIVARAF